MIFVTLLTLVSCKSLQPFQLTYGSGGGFTGLYNTYTISEQGKLFKSSSISKDPVEVATLTKAQLKEIETLIAKVNFPTATAINKPGNMSFFLNLTKDGKSYNNTWSDPKSGNPALDELAAKLNSLIPKK